MTIAMLHPGEMGSAVAACLIGRGERVVYASAGRSRDSLDRANAAGMDDRVTLAAALAEAEIVFSVVPPHAAESTAREVIGCGYRGTYVEANAIAPDTARHIGHLARDAGMHFIDGGIIGPPPAAGRSTRLYLSGVGAQTIAAKLAGSALDTVVLDGGIGAASAVKAAYAAWTKGTIALLAAIRALAHAEGVEAALLDDWRISQPDLIKRSEQITVHAHKSWRWTSEMDEIAKAFAAAGLPKGFHQGAHDVYAALESFKDAKGAVPLASILDALHASGKGRI